MKNPLPPILALALVAASTAAADRDFSRLARDLTPIGAERAGNADGTIPAWEGGLTAPPAGWTPEHGYVDPFPDDRPLFTITAANAAQHAAGTATRRCARSSESATTCARGRSACSSTRSKLPSDRPGRPGRPGRGSAQAAKPLI